MNGRRTSEIALMLLNISEDWPSTAVGSTGYQTSTGLSSNCRVRTPTAQGPLAKNRSSPRGTGPLVVVGGVIVVVGAGARVVVGGVIVVVGAGVLVVLGARVVLGVAVSELA